MDDQTSTDRSTPGRPAVDEAVAALRKDVATHRRDLAGAHEHVDRVVGTLVRCAAALSVLTLLLGVISPVFVPRSGDSRSITLFQATDTSRSPDVMDELDTSASWWIPILAVALCLGFVIATATVIRGWVVTTTEVLCYLLLVGCLLGVFVLSGDDTVASVPIGLVLIVLGGALGIVTVRLARQLG